MLPNQDEKGAAKLHLNFGGYSVAGVKASNEDAFTAMLPTETSVRKYKGAVACIADGVSCSSHAQLASQTAVTNFMSDYYSTPDFWNVQQSAAKVIGSINSWLYQQGHSSSTKSDGWITTFSSLIIKSHTAHLLHAGDSRIYLLRNNELELLTQDHSYQGGGESYLTRALGIERHLDLDYKSLKVQVGDRFLLTTDGVHDTLNHKDLTELASQKGSSLEEVATHIGNVALEAGSNDNISCLIVDVTSLPIERVDELYKHLDTLKIPPALSVGQKIDQFEITQVLHSGTRSHVYLARDKHTDELRVLKMPSLNFSDDTDYLEAFAREQWIGRKLSHPQVMQIFPPPEGSQFLYNVCEYVEGQTLRQWMIDHPQPALDKVRSLLDAMIIPVRALHRAKMVHRDLKPENFIINRDGVVKLIDFGTMKITGIEEITPVKIDELPLGDTNYIAPEYIIHNVVDSGSDLFSVATIIYEMITGKLPYNAIKSTRDYPKQFGKWEYQSILKLAKPPENIPSWVDTVLKKALAPNPLYRYQVMSEFQADLRKPSSTLIASAKSVPLIERNPLRFWQVTSALLLIIVITQWVTYFT
ncbi:bifunctional protein-serine/threonine kinase/phosphatase [Leucothrix arctica]|uniref:Serine/threonine protein kinase n=1 Tax=Leucothrix arctica TaxID=1481894 RepID=A0A317C8Q1_9GAMM|nr:bifunctional protein-serine/threonine kinase/phosphatase [Leucothrix arctica]PWQ94677.1 serine/threonine protein kinase [Leucothrix arctica]